MHKLKQLFPQSVKNLYHLAQALLANVIHGFPSRKIKVIGITGTNGKTTTAQMVAKVLEEAGHRIALASTINFKLGAEEWVNATKYTTLSPFAVQGFIARAVAAGCEYLVLETSSHALDQFRVWGVAYDTAVITNVTREHLDYHGTMEKYRKAKAKLFRKAKVAVVNADMERPEDFLRDKKEKTYVYTCHPERSEGSFALKITDAEIIKAENIELGISGSTFSLRLVTFNLNLPGKFNIENALAAACVGIAENIPLQTIADALAKIKGVPGRMESVKNERGLNIIVDYAVTPDSLEKLYGLLEGTKRAGAKTIAVFGSCGERDRGKRPLMGDIVSRHADYVLITNEDPYYEDPWRIMDEVASGVKNKEEGKDFWKIPDRREAIAKALSLAKEGDMVVVTGKGAEETMAVGERRIPWNDRQVIEEELTKL